MYYCRVCKTELPDYKVGQTAGRICRKCFREYHRQWERKNPEKLRAKRERHKQYARANYNLTDKEMAMLDKKLRTRIPLLMGWSYSPVTGELTLDFGDIDDNAMLAKIEDWKAKAECVKTLRFEFMEMVKEWVE